METGRLDGKRALVTGATSGIGLAIATALAEARARVVVTSRQVDRAEAAAARIGNDAWGRELDVRSEESVERCLSDAYASLGGLDVLVSNAGIGMRTVNPRFMTEPQPFWDVSADGFRDVLATKVTGSFLVARAVAPRMLADGGGRIIVISMNESTMTRRGFIPYGPSGAAVEAAARVMAADLAGSPVTVNIVLPGGATATGMIPDEAPPELRANLLDPAIMGPPVVWLASDAAAGVHDQRIVATEFDPGRR
jgi:NAD(P)-dependent dehydrogenase (short-subunit alcohol dehydrogenase family)